MNTFLKIIGCTALVGVVLVGGFFVVEMNWDKIEYQWDKYTFEPRVSHEGVDETTPLSEILFKLGEPESDVAYEELDGRFLSWKNYRDNIDFQLYAENNTPLNISLYPDAFPWRRDHPVRTTEGLLDLMGEPDIYAETKDFLERHYTYVEHGISFYYKGNRLLSVSQGKVVWRSVVSKTGKYKVFGKQICPSENCPFDEEGEVKPEYKGKSYRDL